MKNGHHRRRQQRIPDFSKGATEYLILEYRQQTGRDVSLPDAGIGTWSIDHLGSNVMKQMTPRQHYKCAMTQTDNLINLDHNTDNDGDVTDLYNSPSAFAFDKYEMTNV